MSSTQARLIDAVPRTRTRPMRVLCLGQSRTGTVSIRAALNKLGYRCFHLMDAVQGDTAHSLALLTELVTLKRSPKKSVQVLNRDTSFPGQAPPWGRREFDALMGDYDACADNPLCEFVDELVEAYPDAKVVLTLRDPDAWVYSMRNTIGIVMQWNWWVAAWDGTMTGPWFKFAELVAGQDWDSEAKYEQIRQSYVEHYEHVRAIVPKERLLEFDLKDGWAPLCEFLDVKAPDEPYPKVNDSKDFVHFHRIMWWMAFGKFVLKTGAVAVVPAAAWLYWFRR